MNRKIFLALLVFTSIFLSSCWIYPDYKSYEIIDGIYFFEDYETMKSIIIPKINTSFSAWHWSSEEFDKKYEQYADNIGPNEEDMSVMAGTDYSYAVRHKSSTANLQTKEGKTIQSEYFWISSKDDGSVIFYQK